MTLRTRIPVWPTLFVLLVGCPIETPRQWPALTNGTDDTIWLQTIAQDLSGPGQATHVDPGATAAIGGHTDPCLSFDTLRIAAEDPAEVDDPEILLEHDLSAQPICERETWVFNGQTLERPF